MKDKDLQGQPLTKDHFVAFRGQCMSTHAVILPFCVFVCVKPCF